MSEQRFRDPQFKATVDRMDLDGHPNQKISREAIERSGLVLKPDLLEYKGSVVIHFYRHSFAKTYAFVTQQVNMNEIEEGAADMGFKEMKKAIMQTYGRTPPKERS